MPIFRKKPVTIEAIRFEGGNHKDILAFGNRNGWELQHTGNQIIIETLEGSMRAGIGDWIIKGVKGEFYPCKHDIFIETYEEVE